MTTAKRDKTWHEVHKGGDDSEMGERKGKEETEQGRRASITAFRVEVEV